MESEVESLTCRVRYEEKVRDALEKRVGSSEHTISVLFERIREMELRMGALSKQVKGSTRPALIDLTGEDKENEQDGEGSLLGSPIDLGYPEKETEMLGSHLLTLSEEDLEAADRLFEGWVNEETAE